MKITIVTKDNLRITYKRVVSYKFDKDDIIIIHTMGPLSAGYADHYKFKDIAGIIIKGKAHESDQR